MDRQDFLKTGLILGGATLFPSSSAFAQTHRKIDPMGRYSFACHPRLGTFVLSQVQKQAGRLCG